MYEYAFIDFTLKYKKYIHFISIYLMMNNNERVQLQKMLQENNTEDQTDNIRRVKHSDDIKRDVIKIQLLHATHATLKQTDRNAFNSMCISQAPFLYSKYTDIFHKVKNEEIDMKMLMDFLRVLKKIEDGVVDQHEGSYEIGKLLKNIYIDSALKKSSKADEEFEKTKEPVREGKVLSYSQFKKMNH
jgi:hypothetical protein